MTILFRLSACVGVVHTVLVDTYRSSSHRQVGIHNKCTAES